jgi:hypothetical protein
MAVPIEESKIGLPNTGKGQHGVPVVQETKRDYWKMFKHACYNVVNCILGCLL